MEVISLPLWLHLCYYMISNKRFVSSVEDSKISNDISGVIKLNTRSEGNIKGSNINEINAQEHSHSSEETRDSAYPVSNQSFKTTRPKSDMLIDLDIKTTKSTPEFDCSEKGNVVTYTANEGYGFYVVKEGRSWWSCTGSDKVIWESRFRSQYLNKVVIETGPNEEKTLTIHCVDGTTAVAKKSKDGDFVLQNEQELQDSKPGDSSEVADAPTDEPSSEQEHTETPEETRDSADHVSPASENLELDATAPTEALTAEPTSEQEPTETPAETKDSEDPVSQEYEGLEHDSSPVAEAPTAEPTSEQEPTETPTDEPPSEQEPTETPTDEPTSEQEPTETPTDEPPSEQEPTETPTDEPPSEEEPSEVSETPESKEDHMTESYQTSDDSKPVDSSPVTEAPTDEPTSEEEPSETPPETRDSTDPVSQEYESLEHDSTAVTEPPTTQPSSEEGHSEVSEETRDSADHVSKQKSETRSPEIKLIDLDLKKTNSSTEFDYSKNNNVVTYTPKAGYGFGTVKIKKGSCDCCGSDKVVWEAEDASKHSNKVVVESGSNEEKTLTIHLVDGTTKVYKTSKGGDFVLQNDDSSKDSKPVDSSPVTEAPTAEPTSEQEPTETPAETKDSEDPVSQEYEGLEHDSSPVAEAPSAEPTSEQEPTETPTDEPPSEQEPTETPTDEPTSEQEPTETPTDEPPSEQEPTETPTDEPPSEQEPTETPEETRDSADHVSPASENLELDATAPTEALTAEPTSEQEPTETPAETKDSEDPVSQEYEGLEHDSSPVAEAPTAEPTSEQEPTETPTDEPPSEQEPTETPTDEPTSEQEPTETPTDEPPSEQEPTETPTDEPPSEQEPTETPEETRDSADHVSPASENLELDATAPTEALTDEPTSEQEPTETPAETKDSADPVSQEYEGLEHDSSPVAEPLTAEPTSEQRAESEEAVRKREADEGSGAKSQTDYSNQSRPDDPSHGRHDLNSQNEATPKSQESNNLSNSQSPKLIDLDIKKTNSSTEFDYSKNGNVVTYTPKPGYGFRTVKEGKGSCNCTGSDKVVWDAEDASKHSNKVVVESGSDKKKTLTIHGVDGTTKVFKKPKNGDFVLQNDHSSKDSKPVDSSPVADSPSSETKLVDLDITKTDSTAEFDYAKNGNVATYTAKEGYGFGTIKKGKGSCSCTGSDEIIWEAKDKSQASNKVTVRKVEEEMNSDLFCLEIYIVDDSKFRYFNSHSPNSPYYKKWVQKSENVPKDLHPAQIKIYTKDETASEAKENDTDKYTVDIFKEGQASKYSYRIKKDVKCTQVKYNNNEVWNDSQDKNHETINRLIFDDGNNNIILEHNGYAFKTYKIPDKPKQK